MPSVPVTISHKLEWEVIFVTYYIQLLSFPYPSPRLNCHKSHAITCSSPDSQGLGMVTGNCCYCCYSDLHLLGTITLNFLVPPGYGSLCHMLALANLSVMVPSSYISF